MLAFDPVSDNPPYRLHAGPAGGPAWTLPGMDFREYSPEDLAAALLALGSELDVVNIEVLAADGSVVARDVLQLHVGLEHDFDRTGGYSWVKITGRQER